MLREPEHIGSREGSALPFGYHVEREPDLLLLRRSDGSLVAAFSVRGMDPFEVELTAWEDAPTCAFLAQEPRTSTNQR